MDVDKKISDLSLRLLGYYNNVGQFLAEETEYINFTRELAKLLKKSFDAIDDVNYDNDFAKALANGVFVMRDKDSNLYAYWPKENIARVTNVTYDRENITILPLEYKYWFTPGNPIQIAKIGTINTITSQKTFYEYVGSSDYIGKQILLQADYLSGNSVSGELQSVGKDFLSIKDNKSDVLLVTNHLCVRINLSGNRNVVANDFNEKSDTLTALGIITKFDKKRGLGYIKSLTGEQLGLREQELLEKNLKVGSEVVFSVRIEKHRNGKLMSQATSVHSPKSVIASLDLARIVSKKVAGDIIQQILDEYPDNQYALLEQLKLSASIGTEKDEDSIKYAKACELLFQSEDKQKAINDLMEILEKGKKVKDCIPKIAMGYFMLYESEEDDEIREIYRKNLREFILLNHSKLNASGSLNIRLTYFNKLELNEDYLQIIDSVLQDPTTDVAKRAKMLYFKALKCKSIGESTWHELARESLYYNPLNNKSELFFAEYNDNDSTSPSCPKEFNRAWNTFFKMAPLKEGFSVYLDKRDSLYCDALLSAIKKDDNINLKAEYISARAGLLSNDSSSLMSALYLWREVFKAIPKFGYFVQENLAKMLSCILTVSIIKDETIETAKNWENKKSWKEILADTKEISKEGWIKIWYACGGNLSVIEHLDSYISTNVILKKSLSKHFGGIEVLSALDETSFLQSDTIALKKIKVAIKDKKTLYDQYEALSELKEDKNFSFVDLLPSNTQLLELFCGKFLSALQSYYLEKNPEDKTLKAKYLNNVIKEVYNFINTTPTELGVEGICVCLEAIEKSLKGVETITRKSAKPEIAIELVEKNVCPDSEGFFHIRVRAKNAPSTITASKVCFELQSEDVEACKVKQVYIDNLKGGAIHDFEYIVKLKQEFLNENSWKFAVNCSYVFDDENSSTNFSPLHVYLSPSTFVAIEHNPYTYGPALKSSDPTFVGRQNDIEEIIDAVLHPEREGAQLIVYGQKRCGKSSLVQAVQSKLERDYSDKALCVYSTLRVEGKDKEKYTEADFYYSILKSIKIVLDGLENKPDLNVPSRLEFKQSSSSTEIFSNCIRDFKQSMRNCSGWKEKRLVLIIDEFTILYNYIKKGVADEGVLHYWKGIQESKDTNFATIFVGHDITPTFFAEPYASNATAIIEKHPLSYLSVDEAKDLIINPISCDGESRFEEKAIEAILYYTACSPSYLQQFMKRMVEYINKEKIVKVTDSDVHYVAQQFIQKNYDEYAADAISSFDNLINSGLDDRYSSIKDKDVENVLRLIALKSKGVEWCNVEDVVKHNYKDENAIESLNKILDDLDSRKVIERRDNNKRIKIKVGIFKEWLIKN